MCALILPKTWRYTSHLLTYLLTYISNSLANVSHSLLVLLPFTVARLFSVTIVLFTTEK